MDGTHLDIFVRTLATRRLSRVQTLRGLVVSGLAALTGLSLVAEEAGAKDNNKNKPRKKRVCLCSAAGCTSKKVKDRAKFIRRNAPCAYKGGCTSFNPCAAGCTPNCEQKGCGDDGCGGSCGTCGAELVCANGQCASRCPGGQKVCAGNCIPNNQCCTGSDCPAATPDCCGGTCVNRSTDVRNCGACGARCTVNEQCVGGTCQPKYFQGTCAAGENFCLTGSGNCNPGSFRCLCVPTAATGANVCVAESSLTCDILNCERDDDCTFLGEGYVCIRGSSTGMFCGCPAGTTNSNFCGRQCNV